MRGPGGFGPHHQSGEEVPGVSHTARCDKGAKGAKKAKGAREALGIAASAVISMTMTPRQLKGADQGCQPCERGWPPCPPLIRRGVTRWPDGGTAPRNRRGGCGNETEGDRWDGRVVRIALHCTPQGTPVKCKSPAGFALQGRWSDRQRPWRGRPPRLILSNSTGRVNGYRAPTGHPAWPRGDAVGSGGARHNRPTSSGLPAPILATWRQSKTASRTPAPSGGPRGCLTPSCGCPGPSG